MSKEPPRKLIYLRYNNRLYSHAGVILIHQDKILLVFGKCHQKWSIPKGHIDPNESLMECAARELYEETGVSVTLTSDNPTFCDERSVYYKHAIDEAPNVEVKDSYEIEKASWFTMPELRNLSEYKTNAGVKDFIASGTLSMTAIETNRSWRRAVVVTSTTCRRSTRNPQEQPASWRNASDGVPTRRSRYFEPFSGRSRFSRSRSRKSRDKKSRDKKSRFHNFHS